MDIFPFDISAKFARLTTALIPIMLGIICHEVAHGWTAWRLGDPTARSLGRLTINPRPHLDITGTLLFLVTSLTSNFILGWAKPVPVDARYFKNPRHGMMLVSAAGPLTNFLLALLFAFAYSFILKAVIAGTLAPGTVVQFLAKMCALGITINATLAWFNLLPIPPLDGSHIVAGILPYKLARGYYAIARYGILIIIVLLGSGLLSRVMGPLVGSTVKLFVSIAGIPIPYR